MGYFMSAGCKISQLREVIVYLGYPISVKFTTSKEAKFLMGKVRKRVNHWSNRLLSLQGRLVLLKHVLRAMLVFHLMALNLNKEGLMV